MLSTNDDILLCPHRSSFQSFAKIAHAGPERLRSLPGFGPVKVRRLVDAFDKPFRNNATSAVPAAPDHAVASQEEHVDVADTAASAPGAPASVKTASTTDAVRSSPAKAATPRSVHSFRSAVDMPPPPLAVPPPPVRTPLTATATKEVAPLTTRDPSPVWDIELDLTEDDFATAGAQLLADSPVESRSGAGQKPPEEAHSPANEIDGTAREPEIGMSRQPTRSQSLVWDIELDLN